MKKSRLKLCYVNNEKEVRSGRVRAPKWEHTREGQVCTRIANDFGVSLKWFRRYYLPNIKSSVEEGNKSVP